MPGQWGQLHVSHCWHSPQGIERLQKAQAELLETVKELDKAKKQFTHLQRSNEVAKDKAADVEAR